MESVRGSKATAGKREEEPRSTRESSRGWAVIRTAALAALALDLVGIPIYVAGTDPQLRGAFGLALAGVALLRGLVAYGAWYRARWSAWVGGFLAIPSLLSPFSQLHGGSVELADNALTAALGWAIAAAAAAFLAGIGMAVRDRVRRNA